MINIIQKYKWYSKNKYRAKYLNVLDSSSYFVWISFNGNLAFNKKVYYISSTLRISLILRTIF